MSYGLPYVLRELATGSLPSWERLKSSLMETAIRASSTVPQTQT